MKVIIHQEGNKIRYVAKENDVGYSYYYEGEIREGYIYGFWKSLLKHENVKGASMLFITKRGPMVGFWIGDAQQNVEWGYWAVSKNKEILENIRISGLA